MASGPSKEELENYWKTSRQYFDELAEYYRTADPEYYDKYIAPFYRYSITSGQPGRKSASPLPVVFVSIALLIMGLVAGVAFLLMSPGDETDKYKEEKKIEKKVKSDEKDQKIDTIRNESPIKKKGRNRTQPIERVR